MGTCPLHDYLLADEHCECPKETGDAFLDEIRTELERIARAQEKLYKDTERVMARLAGKWPR